MTELLLVPAQSDDLAAVVALVEASGLPTEGLVDAFPDAYCVARVGREIVAVAGLETHGRVGLLRSVAVASAQRRTKLGRRLVEDRLRAAREQQLDAVYLLTTTAGDFFRRLGFCDASRQDAPTELQRSKEFESVCPSSAECLAARFLVP